MVTEIRWAWRGIRGRGWRAVFIILLLGVTLAANAVTFSAADAFVFRTVPYQRPDQLVVIGRSEPTTLDYVFPQQLLEWRNHHDLFAGVHGHEFAAPVYLTINGVTESVRAHEVTPGLFDLLGVMPRWGRPFTQADTAAGAAPVVVIGETLARRMFATAEAAVQKSFSTGRRVVTVIGVMPASFRFPSAREQIWYPLDLSKWPHNSGLRTVARLADEQTLERAMVAVVQREAAVGNVVQPPIGQKTMRLSSLGGVRRNPGARTIFAMLLGAAGCLLLIACANVASLELAAAARRIRTHAVLTALGATRGELVRTGLIEAGLLLAASAAVAVGLAALGLTALDRQLTVAMREALTNPLDLDARVIVFMLAAASGTWALTSMPALWRLSRHSIVDGLRDDPRVMPVTQTAVRSRQLLMTGQVALTVLLLVGALLYLQTYAALVGRDKGFDSSRIATIEVFPAPDAPRQEADLEADLLDRLRGLPGVHSVSRTDSLPPATQSGIRGQLTVDDRPQTDEDLFIHFADVDPEYFETMGIAIIEGHPFDRSSSQDEVVVDERLARAYWPAGSAVGSRFRMHGVIVAGVNVFRIVGVSRQLRTDRLTDDIGNQVFQAYIAISPKYHPLRFVARLTDEDRLEALAGMARSIAERSVVRVDTVEARYARLDADRRLAAGVTGGFGTMALLIATSGVFAVMAFLVSGRRREIGIRIALGADRGAVQRLVFGSSLKFVVAGIAMGLAASTLAAQGIASQLFHVAAIDPATYTGVGVLVLGTALAATWWPARRAAGIDPASILRTE